jgi:16S rRNA (uracil1498-N3)-methyltransferase
VSQPSGRDGPHAFVDDLDAPDLTPEDRHHLARVLRLRPGDSLTVSDGRGGWRLCRFGEELEPVGDSHQVPRPAPVLTVAFALVKGERPEWAVQKLTELGIDRIIPFVAARSVVRWEPDRASRQVERLRRVAREAAMQSRRCYLPALEDVASFADVATLPGATLADPAGRVPQPGLATVLVGPEGGWAAEEEVAGLPRVRLGDHVLRTETAAVAGASLIAALRAGIVRHSVDSWATTERG